MGAIERARRALELARAGGSAGRDLGGQALAAAKKKIKERPTALRTMQDAGYTALGGGTLAGGYLLKRKFDRELDEEEERKLAPLQKESSMAGIFGSEAFDKIARRRGGAGRRAAQAQRKIQQAAKAAKTPPITPKAPAIPASAAAPAVSAPAASAPAIAAPPVMAAPNASPAAPPAAPPAMAAPNVSPAAPPAMAKTSPASAALAARQSTPMALAQGATSPNLAGGVSAAAPATQRKYNIDPTMGGTATPSAAAGLSPMGLPSAQAGAGAVAAASPRPAAAAGAMPEAPVAKRQRPTENPRTDAAPQAAAAPTTLEPVNQKPKTQRQLRNEQAAKANKSEQAPGKPGRWMDAVPRDQDGGVFGNIDPRWVAGGAAAAGAGLLGYTMLSGRQPPPPPRPQQVIVQQAPPQQMPQMVPPQYQGG